MTLETFHLARLRAGYCALCGHRASEAHHVRSAANSGVGIKPGARHTVGLCHACHERGHRIGWKTMEREHDVNLARTTSIEWRVSKALWIRTRKTGPAGVAITTGPV